MENRRVPASNGCHYGGGGRGGGKGHQACALRFFKVPKVRVCFGLPSGIDKVVTMMAHLNKVLLASPHLVNISGVKKGHVNVGFAKFVGFI